MSKGSLESSSWRNVQVILLVEIIQEYLILGILFLNVLLKFKTLFNTKRKCAYFYYTNDSKLSLNRKKMNLIF